MIHAFGVALCSFLSVAAAVSFFTDDDISLWWRLAFMLAFVLAAGIAILEAISLAYAL